VARSRLAPVSNTRGLASWLQCSEGKEYHKNRGILYRNRFTRKQRQLTRSDSDVLAGIWGGLISGFYSAIGKYSSPSRDNVEESCCAYVTINGHKDLL
jgi:hypothetical protein